MANSPPKTLEYSSVKRSRKRVVMIVVLVLASLAVAFVGRAWAERVSNWYRLFTDERNTEAAVNNDIVAIWEGRLKYFSDSNPIDLPYYPAGLNSYTQGSSAWYAMRTRAKNVYRAAIFPTTTACLARLNAGNGVRYIGVDLNIDGGFDPHSVTAIISAIQPRTVCLRLSTTHEVIRPVATFRKSLSVKAGTRDPNHPDRATFKVIADGVEKNFVVILRKDDTVAFEEQSP